MERCPARGWSLRIKDEAQSWRLGLRDPGYALEIVLPLSSCHKEFRSRWDDSEENLIVMLRCMSCDVRCG
jgi:hypothetical protein